MNCLGSYALKRSSERSLDALSEMESVLTNSIGIFSNFARSAPVARPRSDSINFNESSARLVLNDKASSSLNFFNFWNKAAADNTNRNSIRINEKINRLDAYNNGTTESVIIASFFDRSLVVYRKITHIVVITTLRLIVIECKRDMSEDGIDFKEIWQVI